MQISLQVYPITLKGGDVMNKNLRERINDFLAEFGIPATAFCKRVNISYSAYQNWKRNTQKFSQSTEDRISEYLAKYNF